MPPPQPTRQWKDVTLAGACQLHSPRFVCHLVVGDHFSRRLRAGVRAVGHVVVDLLAARRGNTPLALCPLLELSPPWCHGLNADMKLVASGLLFPVLKSISMAEVGLWFRRLARCRGEGRQAFTARL